MQLALRGKGRTWREYTLPAFKALLVINVVEVSGMEQKSEPIKKYHAPDSITPPNRRASVDQFVHYFSNVVECLDIRLMLVFDK